MAFRQRKGLLRKLSDSSDQRSQDSGIRERIVKNGVFDGSKYKPDVGRIGGLGETGASQQGSNE